MGNGKPEDFKSPNGHVKRPMNAFMLFARERRSLYKSVFPKMSNCEISSLLGQTWSNMDLQSRQRYEDEAHMLSRLHQQMYPDYVYRPRRGQAVRSPVVLMPMRQRVPEHILYSVGPQSAAYISRPGPSQPAQQRTSAAVHPPMTQQRNFVTTGTTQHRTFVAPPDTHQMNFATPHTAPGQQRTSVTPSTAQQRTLNAPPTAQQRTSAVPTAPQRTFAVPRTHSPIAGGSHIANPIQQPRPSAPTSTYTPVAAEYQRVIDAHVNDEGQLLVWQSSPSTSTGMTHTMTPGMTHTMTPGGAASDQRQQSASWQQPGNAATGGDAHTCGDKSQEPLLQPASEASPSPSSDECTSTTSDHDQSEPLPLEHGASTSTDNAQPVVGTSQQAGVSITIDAPLGSTLQLVVADDTTDQQHVQDNEGFCNGETNSTAYDEHDNLEGSDDLVAVNPLDVFLQRDSTPIANWGGVNDIINAPAVPNMSFAQLFPKDSDFLNGDTDADNQAGPSRKRKHEEEVNEGEENSWMTTEKNSIEICSGPPRKRKRADSDDDEDDDDEEEEWGAKRPNRNAWEFEAPSMSYDRQIYEASNTSASENGYSGTVEWDVTNSVEQGVALDVEQDVIFLGEQEVFDEEGTDDEEEIDPEAFRSAQLRQEIIQDILANLNASYWSQ